MREILNEINTWVKNNKKAAIATVVKIYGSAPRGLGAKMAVNEDGQMAGSVSGGCVEGAVVGEALQVIKSQQPKLLHYGISNETAFSVGLACGGEIEIFVEPLKENVFLHLMEDLKKQRLTVLVKIIQGNFLGAAFQFYNQESFFDWGDFPDQIRQNVIQEAKIQLSTQQCARKKIDLGGEELEIFYDVFPPEPKLVMIGAVHIAIPLVKFAKEVGFQTIVVDPRKAFATPERFAHADQLILKWPQDYLVENPPDEGTYVVTISHDEKLDVPALRIACESDAFYVGALGSKKTFSGYKQQIIEAGGDEYAVERIYSPVGLDIGARGPEEIALAIIAQVVKRRNGK